MRDAPFQVTQAESRMQAIDSKCTCLLLAGDGGQFIVVEV